MPEPAYLYMVWVWTGPAWAWADVVAYWGLRAC